MSQTVNKITAERNQRTLLELASQPGNDVCADCKTRNPRWASYNLGIFICVSCASIHRKMGTHISKVKSLTLDSWTKEQVEFMKTMGNVKSNAHYNPDEIRNPPPTNMIESERDSDLEKYIRSKYEYKSFRPRTAKVAELLGPSRSAASRQAALAEPPRSKTVPVPTSSTTTSSATTVAARPAPAIAQSSSTASSISQTQSQFRSVSQPVAPSQTQLSSQTLQQPQQQAQQQLQQPPQQSSNPLWNDLAQLQAPATNSSLPLQYASPATTQPISIPTMSTGLTAPNAYGGLSVSPNSPFPSLLQQHSPGGMFPGGQLRSMSLNTGLSVGGGMGYGAGTSPGMMGSSPMLHPQPTLGGGLSAPMSMLPQNTTPSPSPFTPQPLPQTGYGMQQQPLQTGASTFAPSSFGQQQNQPFLQSQPQGSPMFNPSQQLPYGSGSSPMFQSQPLGQGQMPMLQQQMQGMSMGGSYLQAQQPQQPYGAQPSFMGAPSPTPYGQPQGSFQQQPQQQMYGQGSAFGGTGWQPQQQWGGM